MVLDPTVLLLVFHGLPKLVAQQRTASAGVLSASTRCMVATSPLQPAP